MNFRYFFSVCCALLALAATDIVAQGKVKISPLTINSSADDFASVFTGNRNTMYFTSDRDGDGQRAYSSIGWSTPEEVDGEVNDGSQIGAVAITPDGQYMIFAAYDHDEAGQGRTDLYSARRVDGEWSDIENLGAGVNSESWDSQPVLSGDGSVLYFASDRPGGKGGTDIYRSTRQPDGWSAAVNVGGPVNSSSDDMSPVIAPDNKTFYFASNRSGGRGGFDIWSSRVFNNSFEAPRNLKEPINSASDEYFYMALVNSDIAYFSSDRTGGSGALDIYTAVPNPVKPEPVRVVQGVVSDAETGNPLGASMLITDLETGARVGELRSDDLTGDYLVILPAGKKYSVTAEKPGYLFYSERFDVPANEKGEEVNYDIQLSRTSTRLLVNFDFDSSTLKPESRSEMNRVVSYLNDNPSVKIEVAGHTDDVGNDEYNDKLSERRAEAVKTFLAQKGIDSDRVATVGFGKRKPLSKEDTDEARARNRRVEMRIVL